MGSTNTRLSPGSSRCCPLFVSTFPPSFEIIFGKASISRNRKPREEYLPRRFSPFADSGFALFVGWKAIIKVNGRTIGQVDWLERDEHTLYDAGAQTQARKRIGGDFGLQGLRRFLWANGSFNRYAARVFPLRPLRRWAAINYRRTALSRGRTAINY